MDAIDRMIKYRPERILITEEIPMDAIDQMTGLIKEVEKEFTYRRNMAMSEANYAAIAFVQTGKAEDKAECLNKLRDSDTWGEAFTRFVKIAREITDV